LRSWVAGDEKTLTEIQNLAFAGHWGFSPNTVEEIAYRARMSFCRPEGILFIIEGEKAVGYCWTRMEQGPRCVTGFIGMMGSHPGYRGRGLGVTVMRVGVGYLRKAGADRVDLTVDSENHSALKIYRAGGFERIAVTLWYERRL
ncbi:MAG: GNAT family N-acetyltransferase, partial [Dehalococcoidia bacterium]